MSAAFCKAHIHVVGIGLLVRRCSFGERPTPFHGSRGEILSCTNPCWTLFVPRSKAFPLSSSRSFAWSLWPVSYCQTRFLYVQVHARMRNGGRGWTETYTALGKQNLLLVGVPAACGDDGQTQWSVAATAGHGQHLKYWESWENEQSTATREMPREMLPFDFTSLT